MKLKIIKKYLDLGFSIFPVKRKEKTPATANGFKDASNSIDQIKIWEREIYLNVGIATGLKSGISVVDVDPDSGGSESLKMLITEHGLDINTFTVKTPRGGVHLYYSDKIGAKTRTAVLPGIDIRGDGGYVVAPPSLHPNGINYDFAVNDFESMRREEFLSKLKVFPSEIIDLVGRKNKKTSIPNEGNVTEGNRFEHLRTQIGKLRRSGISRESARILLQNENKLRCVPPKTEEQVNKLVDGIYNLQPTDKILSAPFTDLGNSERLNSFLNGHAIFIRGLGKWALYDGSRFEVTDLNSMIQVASTMLRFAQDIAVTQPESEFKKKLIQHLKVSESKSKIHAMISLAESETTTDLDVLDSNPYLFNVKNGTVDLKTGNLLTHKIEDKFTKLSGVSFDASAECPRFMTFLNEVFNSNEALIKYFQKVIGYALTGKTDEQCLFLLNGNGSNGKSTMIAVCKFLFGEYCRSTDISTFTFKQSEQIRNDLARLFDARVVTSVEIQEGKFLDESIVKQATGGDPITCRFLFKEHIEYIPKWKLFLAVNHLPHITGTDRGIWRRMKIIPFNMSFEGANKDPELLSKLERELPGILNWAIQGCLLWQKEQLQSPAEVLEAVEQYRLDEDLIGDFLLEFVDLGDSYIESASVLYSCYSDHQRKHGQRVPTQKQFGQKLSTKGFKRQRDGNGRVVYLGLMLKPYKRGFPNDPKQQY